MQFLQQTCQIKHTATGAGSGMLAPRREAIVARLTASGAFAA